MALQKVDYVNQVTVITAENMNAIQDAIIALEETPAQGLTEDMKQALLQIARKVAYIDDKGQTYYQDLYDALYPPKTVVLITAVFEQGSTVIYDDTALDDLKQYLTVTAKYDDNTTAILADSSYTLSGLLEAGTSTVTVAYNGLTTTFTVNVTARPTLSSISAAYTQSGTVYETDNLDSLKADLVVTATYTDSSTATVAAADYTLSGTLTAGTSTITVSYGGKTTTFSVTVEEATPLYTLPAETVFDGTNAVNTGIKLLETDRDFTILAEFTNGAPLSNSIVFDCRQSNSPYYGMGWYERATGFYAFTGPVTTNVNSEFQTTEDYVVRLAIRHSVSGANWTADGMVNGVRKAQNSVSTQKTITSVNNSLFVGGKSTAETSVKNWSGTMHSFKVYDRRFSDSEVTQWLGV